jgi:iron complex outermembrane receptor protein
MCLVSGAIAGLQVAHAQESTPTEAIQVTATRVPEPVDRVPADISIVSDHELQRRDAWDMATALSLVPGVDAPSGGDAGPSSAVPSFLGLHEFDAFLLVVDGVPWGGAFNPMIPTLNFNDVERIEVLKGAAPVMYGATSFVGVVHVLHFPAGQASNRADLEAGSYGSARGSASLVLPQSGPYRQSLALDGQSLGFADRRERVADSHVLYRGALEIGAGSLCVDADATVVRDVPPSPIVRAGKALTTLTPIDANFNPADARIDQNEYQLAVGYKAPTAWGRWESRLSVAHSDLTDVRAFLHPDLSGTADTQNQDRHIDDDFFDTHLSSKLSDETVLATGVDLLYGLGRQRTLNDNSAYTVPLNGSMLPPSTSQLPANEIGSVHDRRLFVGQYAQLDWRPVEAWDVLGGLRLNETYEHKVSSDLLLSAAQLSTRGASKSVLRPTGTVGTSFRAWEKGKDEAVLYVDYRNAFKPAAIDFGPDYTPQVLQPETAQSYEGGIKGAVAGGRLAYQAELFWVNFKNLVVATSDGALANAGGERLKGAEFETRFLIDPALALVGNFTIHDARYTQYLFFDNVSSTSVSVAGRQLPLSPHILASAGVLYTRPNGVNMTVVARWIGPRYLDEENMAPVAGYLTLDATLGYRARHLLFAIEGSNLTNRRPPVTSSEFGGESFYVLPARRLWLRLGYTGL